MKTSTFGIFIITLALALPFASASIVMDGVSFDPSVVAAGDEVIISVNFHNEIKQSDAQNYLLETILEPGDSTTARYVTILDNEGGVGMLYGGQAWTKTFRVKVHENAPIGTYELKILFKERSEQAASQVEYFTMRVTKEGIILDLANVITTPREVRPGDNYITIETYLENSGQKDAKAIELQLEMPEGFSSPFSNNNRAWAGYIEAGGQQALTGTFSIDETVTPGTYEFIAHFLYRDENDNNYEKHVTFPIMVREKPVIIVTANEGEILAGGKGELRVTMKNIGSETAEAVDVRLIKESSQPFSFDARTDHVGTLKPGEEAQAVFIIKAEPGASFKTHSFTALIRAKGDSDIGDDNIYTFSREASIDVTGKQPNIFLYLGAGVLIIVVLVVLVKAFGKRKKR
jgi:hypothetical protein